MLEWKNVQIYFMIFAVLCVGSWFMKLMDMLAAFVVLLFVGVIFMYHNFMERRFPVLVPLFIERKGHWSFRLDTATRKKDENGIEYYHLRNTKKDVKPPHYENIIETVRGHVLPLFSPSESEYRELNLNGSNVTVMDEDMKQWYKYWVKKAYADWAPEMSLWVRYMPVIFLAVLGGIVIVVLYIITGDLALATSAATNAANTLNNAVTGIQGVITSTPPPA